MHIWYANTGKQIPTHSDLLFLAADAKQIVQTVGVNVRGEIVAFAALRDEHSGRYTIRRTGVRAQTHFPEAKNDSFIASEDHEFYS